MSDYFKIYKLQWSQFDVNRHLKNIAYSELANEVRINFLEDHGFFYKEFERLNIGPILMREDTHYLKEVDMNALTIKINIKLMALSHEGSLFRFKHEFFKSDGELAAKMIVDGGWLNLEARTLTIPDKGISEALKKMTRDVNYDESYFSPNAMIKRAKAN